MTFDYMTIVTALFIYALVWWTVIYAVLPFGNKAPENPETGHASSAPANPRIKQKLLWTSLISVVVTGIILAGIHYSGFSFHESAKEWSQEN